MKLAEIASLLGATLENGDPEAEITGVAGIEEASAGHITFVANPKYAAAAKTTSASAVIVSEDFPAIATGMLRSKNPYLAFARAIDLFYQASAVRCRCSSHGGDRAYREAGRECSRRRIRGDR